MRFESLKLCLVPQLLVLLVLVPLLVGTQQADALSSEPLDTQLGRGLYLATAAAVGEKMYLFGGAYYAGEQILFSDQVVSIDARTGELRNLTSLPRPLEAPSAITVGDAIYVIGGLDGGAVGTILRFDVRHATFEANPTPLPVPLGMSCVASDGRDIYIFGGWDPTTGGTSDAIQKFTPSTGQVAILPTRLPSPRTGCASTFAEGAFWILGGDVRTGATVTSGSLDEILRYDPSSGVIAAMPERLPSPRSHMAAAWNGSALILAGGAGARAPLSAVLAFHPTDRSLVQVANLVTPRSAASAAVVDGTVLVAGGYGDETTKGLRDIVAIGRPLNSSVIEPGAQAPSSKTFQRILLAVANNPFGAASGFIALFGFGTYTLRFFDQRKRLKVWLEECKTQLDRDPLGEANRIIAWLTHIQEHKFVLPGKLRRATGEFKLAIEGLSGTAQPVPKEEASNRYTAAKERFLNVLRTTASWRGVRTGR